MLCEAELIAGVDAKVKTTMAGARKESECVMFTAFSKLLEAQHLRPSQVNTLAAYPSVIAWSAHAHITLPICLMESFSPRT